MQNSKKGFSDNYIKKMNKKLKIFYTIVYILTAISAVMGVIFTFVLNKPEFALQETGCIEVSQAAILVVAFLTYIISLCSKGGKDEKMMTLALAVLMYAFIVRELDFERMNLPDWIVAILYGEGRTITVITGFAIAFIGMAMRFKHYFKTCLNFLKTKRAKLLIIGGIFLIIGNVIEHATSWGNLTEVVEEETELLGYCFILSSAILTKKYVDCDSE